MPRLSRRARALDSRYADFEAAANVGLASSESVRGCSPSDVARTVLDRLPDFDCIPVLDAGQVVGVLKRTPASGRPTPVQDEMDPVDDSTFVRSTDPLLPVFEAMGGHTDFRLVGSKSALKGIITLSDMNKLPARALIFCRITHVELLIATIISTRVRGDEHLVSLFSAKRRAVVLQKHSDLAKKRSNLDLLAATEFADKRTALRKLGGVRPYTQTRLDSLLERIQNLRDDVAHADSGYAEPQNLSATASLLSQMRDLVESLRAVISTASERDS